MPDNFSTPSAAPYALTRVRRVVDVDAVDDIAGFAKVHGKEIAVHHLDAEAYRAIQALRVDPASADFSLLYDAIERACPDLTRAEIDRLSGPKIGALLAIAEEGIKEVEASIPNAPGATETNDSPPPSSLETSSVTSSPASRSQLAETSAT